MFAAVFYLVILLVFLSGGIELETSTPGDTDGPISVRGSNRRAGLATAACEYPERNRTEYLSS